MPTIETVYQEHNRQIYYLCLKLTKNPAEAEDLMQDVWMKVVCSQAYLENVDHVKAWLTTITMNTFRDKYRKDVRRSKHMVIQPDQLDVSILDLIAADTLPIDEQLAKENVSEIIQEKLGQLDAIYSKTVFYFYVKQLSLVEIAELMKVSIGTVKSRLFRAKQRLRELILKDEDMAEMLLVY
ncbi:RNA polymerase sigma factor [Chryseomicrobium palamuruense]|uniref:RNA polymerase sigma factor n=1 Tax=Chryseomicrobium palamuruense TaxID=682973 RepID=A0ABV8URX2_9BACL